MKNNIFRIILFIVTMVCGFTGPLWLFACGVIAYSFLYFGIELIFIAVAVDAYFGYAENSYYLYTLGTTAVLFLAQYLKPRLSLYNR